MSSEQNKPLPHINWKSLPVPEVGSRWDGKMYGWDGEKCRHYGMVARTAKVMAVADGYVMARCTGAMPFVSHLNEWFQKWTPKPGMKSKVAQ